MAKKLPQGREGQAIVWRINKDETSIAAPENLFLRGDIDRQDLIGEIFIYVLIKKIYLPQDFEREMYW